MYSLSYLPPVRLSLVSPSRTSHVPPSRTSHVWILVDEHIVLQFPSYKKRLWLHTIQFPKRERLDYKIWSDPKSFNQRLLYFNKNNKCENCGNSMAKMTTVPQKQDTFIFRSLETLKKTLQGFKRVGDKHFIGKHSTMRLYEEYKYII